MNNTDIVKVEIRSTTFNNLIGIDAALFIDEMCYFDTFSPTMEIALLELLKMAGEYIRDMEKERKNER